MKTRIEAAPSSLALAAPIARGEAQPIVQITLRKPSAGELRGLKLSELLAMEVSSIFTLLPRICEPTLTSEEMNALDPADLATIGVEIVSFFLNAGDRERLASTSPTALKS